ncbi:MAG: hypothetical protein P8J33_05920 [Pirellulaceae bacterium]|nr:hypothetical protein [Pirellulaceae bacterium]
MSNEKQWTPESANRFYWRSVLPWQSLMMTSFTAPMYGFNALI